MIAEEVAALLKRVHAGSLDAEHDIAEEIARLRTAPIYYQNVHWEPIATVPVPSAAELVAGAVVVDGMRRTIYTWTGRFLIQTTSGYVTEATCRYIKKCATAKVEQLELRWYVGRVWERNAKYWMPLPAPKVET